MTARSLRSPGVIGSASGYRSRSSPSWMGANRLLNRRFGRDMVSFAAAGWRCSWKMRSEFLSPRFTTNWAAVGVDPVLVEGCCDRHALHQRDGRNRCR